MIKKFFQHVVSYRNSTSNHNRSRPETAQPALYLIEILHQTTTAPPEERDSISCILSKFYIKPQLVDDKECRRNRCILSKFYIKPQRFPQMYKTITCCILSKFYIKPQHGQFPVCVALVVSYRNSTSNHNRQPQNTDPEGVVSYRNSTSNHNVGPHID